MVHGTLQTLPCQDDQIQNVPEDAKDADIWTDVFDESSNRQVAALLRRHVDNDARRFAGQIGQHGGDFGEEFVAGGSHGARLHAGNRCGNRCIRHGLISRFELASSVTQADNDRHGNGDVGHVTVVIDRWDCDGVRLIAGSAS